MKKLIGLFICVLTVILFTFNAFALFEPTYKNYCTSCGQLTKCHFLKFYDKEDENRLYYYYYSCSSCENKGAKEAKELAKSMGITYKRCDEGRDASGDWQDYFYKKCYHIGSMSIFGDPLTPQSIQDNLVKKDDYKKALDNFSAFIAPFEETNFEETVFKIVVENDRDSYWYKDLTKEILLNNTIEETLKKSESFLKYCDNNSSKNKKFREYSKLYKTLMEEKKKAEEEKKRKEEEQRQIYLAQKRESDFSTVVDKIFGFVTGDDSIAHWEKEWKAKKYVTFKEKGYVDISGVLFQNKKVKPLETSVSYTLTQPIFDSLGAGYMNEKDLNLLTKSKRFKRVQELSKEDIVSLLEEKCNLTNESATKVATEIKNTTYFEEYRELFDIDTRGGYYVCLIENLKGWSMYEDEDLIPNQVKELDNKSKEPVKSTESEVSTVSETTEKQDSNTKQAEDDSESKYTKYASLEKFGFEKDSPERKLQKGEHVKEAGWIQGNLKFGDKEYKGLNFEIERYISNSYGYDTDGYVELSINDSLNDNDTLYELIENVIDYKLDKCNNEFKGDFTILGKKYKDRGFEIFKHQHLTFRIHRDTNEEEYFNLSIEGQKLENPYIHQQTGEKLKGNPCKLNEGDMLGHPWKTEMWYKNNNTTFEEFKNK